MGLSYKEWKRIEKGIEGFLQSQLLMQWQGIFTSVFEWKTEHDLELGRHIERYLFIHGSVAFFKNDNGFGVLPYAQTSGVNMYGELVTWNVIGATGVEATGLSDSNSVIIRANKLRRSNYAYVLSQVNRMVNIEEAIDTNINTLKVPFILSGNEDSLITLKNMYKKIVRNDPMVYVDKSLNVGESFKAFNLGLSYHGVELMNLYNDIEGRLLKVAGLKYVHTEKKERLVVDEVNSNDGLSNTFLWDALNERQIACERINKMFPDMKISVDINPLLKLTDPNKDEGEGKGGEEVE